MPDLEQQLNDLAPAIAWPPTPHLTGLPRLRGSTAEGGDGAARRWGLPRLRGSTAEGGDGAARRWGLPRWALAAAAALLIAAGALVAFPPTRTAIADFLNLHTTIHRVQQLPTPSSGPGHSLNLGTPTTLAEAQGHLAWTVAVPASLGAPDAVYLAPPGLPSGGEVSLVYTARPGIKASGETGVAVLVTEARGTVNEQFFGKIIGPDATIESVTVNGHAGWWIAGKPHIFFFTDENGNVVNETLRLATNTLLLDDGGTVVRIEGDLTRDQALRIAASL